MCEQLGNDAKSSHILFLEVKIYYKLVITFPEHHKVSKPAICAAYFPQIPLINVSVVEYFPRLGLPVSGNIFFRQMGSSVLVSLLSLSTESSVLAWRKKEQREDERGGKV